MVVGRILIRSDFTGLTIILPENVFNEVLVAVEVEVTVVVAVVVAQNSRSCCSCACCYCGRIGVAFVVVARQVLLLLL